MIGVSACSILQVPLRLAWALTIHKSQVIAHLIRVGDGGVGGIVGVVGVVGGGVVVVCVCCVCVLFVCVAFC